MLIELIKQLAIEQAENKKQRKTGPYTLETDKWGYVDQRKAPEKVRSSWCAAGRVRALKVRITAALNLYHELRGSGHRHNVPADDYSYTSMYANELAALREEYKKTPDGTIAIP